MSVAPRRIVFWLRHCVSASGLWRDETETAAGYVMKRLPVLASGSGVVDDESVLRANFNVQPLMTPTL